MTVDDLARVLGTWVSEPGPLYERLAAAIRTAIVRGELRAGTRLPPERGLATTLAISRSTVVGAYDLMRQEDLIWSRQGSGTYVRTPPNRDRWTEIEGLESSLQNAVFKTRAGDELGSIEFTAAALPGTEAIPDVVWERAIDAMRQLSKGHGYEVLGIPALRQAVARRLTETGLKTRPSEVLITNGAQQAISLMAALFVRPGDTVLIEDPSWIGAIDAFRAMRARIVGVPVDSDGILVDRCRELAALHSPALLYLSPSFHNPTGACMSDRRRRELAQLSLDLRLPIIEDNTLAELDLVRPPPPPIAARAPGSPVATIGSLSKLYWGGLRIGWVRAPEAMIVRLAHLKLVFDHGSSLASQAIATLLFESLDNAKSVRRRQMRARLAVAAEELGARLPDWRWVPPAGGLSLWVQLPRGNSTEFSQVAMRHGVIVVPGTMASASRSHGDCLRLPIVHEPEILIEGVRRLGVAWGAYLDIIDHRQVHEVLV